MIIEVQKGIGDGFGEPIAEIFRIKRLIDIQPQSEIVIDLSKCSFLHPFLFLVLKLVQKFYDNQGYKIIFNTNCIDSSFSNYLSTVYFPDCLVPELMASSNDLLNKYQSKSYIPLSAYNVAATSNSQSSSSKLVNLIDELLNKQLRIPPGLMTAVKYLLGEAQDNISNHSGSEYGFVMAQYYRNKRYLDICIADEGKSILGSYQQSNRYPFIFNDEQALRKAISGFSTKGNDERGYGICTSIEILTRGLKGHYFLWSGNAFFYNKEVYKLPGEQNIRIGGAILFLRIPTDRNEFDIYKFV